MNQPAENAPSLSWADDGIPVNTSFDDPYFTGGLAETQHVFLAGNGLPERLKSGFHVSELGFGTGLNLLALAEIWNGPGRIHFTSFEAHPMAAHDMARALDPFELSHKDDLVTQWETQSGEVRQICLQGIDASILIGDARQTLPAWKGSADAWFLDGFAPAKNPELWSEELLRGVAQHTNPGGTIATYTAAGHVRRSLAAGGFEVARIPGFGRKKHMTFGRMPI